MFPRNIQPKVMDALVDTPVVLLSGPRQAGKTTLVWRLAGSERRYLTLDDEVTRLAAKEDPVGLIRSLDSAVIDEVQRAPDLLLAIKKTVDEDRRPGRFLLTGSANLMALPGIADSLAGRMETLVLLPLAQCEIAANPGSSLTWLDTLFADGMLAATQPAVGEALVDKVIRGGYPEALSRADNRRRRAWARQYIDALIQRDIKDIASIDKLDQVPRLLRALAQTAGQLCNYSQLGGQVGIDHKTASKYIAIFEQMYLMQRVPVWSGNRLSRLVKTPKLQFLDSGLLGVLLDFSDPMRQRNLFGQLLESYVFAELRKQATWSEGEYGIHYYRDKDQYEVDFVVENASGEIIGIEVKAAASVSISDLAGLKRLANAAPRNFKAGIVLYDGTETLPLGAVNDRPLWAMPIATLTSSRIM
ncbi:MAG: AAA family ATPase [Betaproteobacteria bacterium RBG_16_56_24]|nr:MAG: AAA family ATPase [Betaproteobacteria bacterium RBG_16_56_24]